MPTTQDPLKRVVAAFRERMSEHEGDDLDNPEALGAEAADFAISRHARAHTVADRVGPVHTTDDLARYLAGPHRPLTTEAVRKRAKQRRLVSFVSGDGLWLFPAWQFVAAGGRLEPLEPVIEVWQALPHDAAMDAADLAMWMNTPLRSLDGDTPARRAARAGADDLALSGSVSRLRARATGRVA